MFITKEMDYKDFLPTRESFTKHNNLMLCEDFGFVYFFFDEITPKDTGNIEIVFDILCKDVYKEPDVLIPTEEYKDLFIEFKEICFSNGIRSDQFYILEKEDFMLFEPMNREPVKLMLPAGSLVFKSMVDKHSRLAVMKILQAFWKGDIVRKGELVGYSKNKKLKEEK